MNYIENIILYCLKQLNGERTIYSIFHLLNGKKSSQTIQDAHLFSLKRYFRILENLTRETFDEIITQLNENGWVDACGDQKYLLSESGDTYLKSNLLPAHTNGWKYQQITTLVWERLSILVQVTSHLTHKESRYVPIQKSKEVHLWLKTSLQQLSVTREKLGKILYEELMDCLNEVEGINQNVLVFRLTGYQQIGLTSFQIAKKLKMGPIQYDLEFINILHFIIHTVENDKGRYPVLSQLLTNIEVPNALTLTSRKTWELLNQGLSIDQIAAVRHLKISTIEDHLVEFALHINEFSIDSYVDKNTQQKVINIARESNTRQLKVIRNSLKTASYFQIRLVLAKYGERQWN
nr:helix-turn-helix domain-containing protein [Neobacillus sp. Marseille-Q6967]